MGDDSVWKSVYPEIEFGGFSRFDGTIHFFSRVQALLPGASVVLDVGCGRGSRVDERCDFRRSIQDLRGTGRHVIGIDVDEAASSNPWIDEFRLLEDSSRWPVDDDSVDVICSDYVIEHVADPASFFSEAFRVLRPGGSLAMRTPNARGYVALAARLIPNRLHARVTGTVQGSRKAEDVFPTLYRANTRRALTFALGRAGFNPVVYAIESEPSYMQFSALAFRAAAAAHRVMPPPFRSTLLAFARKPDLTQA